MSAHPPLVQKTRGFDAIQPEQAVKNRARLKEIYENYSKPCSHRRRNSASPRSACAIRSIASSTLMRIPNKIRTEWSRMPMFQPRCTRCSSIGQAGSVVGTARLILPRRGRGTIALPIRDVCHREFIVRDTPNLT
jgi:hypothetical protein